MLIIWPLLEPDRVQTLHGQREEGCIYQSDYVVIRVYLRWKDKGYESGVYAEVL